MPDTSLPQRHTFQKQASQAFTDRYPNLDTFPIRTIASASKAAMKATLQTRRSITAVVCLSILALAQPHAPAQTAPMQDALQRGALAMRNGRSADAEKAFREAVRLAPDSPEARLDLGLVLGREGNQEEAISALQTAIQLDPKLASAHMFLGVFLYQSNRHQDAITALNQELAMNPRNAEASTWLGIVQLANGHPELAVGPLDSAAAITPDDLNLLQYRGRAHSLVAQDSYARMARLSPDAWQVHKVQAELYAEEEKHADAIREYQSAIAHEQRNPDLYEGLGDEYRKLNELESAQKAYTRELELSPHNPIAMYNLGSTEIERGDPASGVSLLEAMLKTYQQSPVVEYYLGRGLAAQGRDADATIWLEKSAQGDTPEIKKRSFYELARLYRKLQRTTDAQRALAEYNLLRETQEKQTAAKWDDWHKLNASGIGTEEKTQP